MVWQNKANRVLTSFKDRWRHTPRVSIEGTPLSAVWQNKAKQTPVGFFLCCRVSRATVRRILTGRGSAGDAPARKCLGKCGLPEMFSTAALPRKCELRARALCVAWASTHKCQRSRCPLAADNRTSQKPR
jgi:hypothetical protein